MRKYIIEVFHDGKLIEVTNTSNLDHVRVAVLSAKRFGDSLIINTVDEGEKEND